MFKQPRRITAVVGVNRKHRKVALELASDTYHLSPAEALEVADRLVAASEQITLAAP